MSTPTLTNAAGQSTRSPSGRHQRPDDCDTYTALWAMSRDERIAAMWRRELSLRQLCQWSSRTARGPTARRRVRADRDAHTRLGQSQQQTRRRPCPRRPPGGRPVTIALTTIGSRIVTLTVGPSALEEARDGDGVGLKPTLHDGPLVLTVNRDEAQTLVAELTEQLAETREAP